METTSSNKAHYSEQELKRFEQIILAKIASARNEFADLMASLQLGNPNSTENTSAAYSTLEDGAATLEKETLQQMAGRQKKFIEQLEWALTRIGNKTYGVCRATGKLIPKERLIAVPHTTLCIEAKNKMR